MRSRAAVRPRAGRRGAAARTGPQCQRRASQQCRPHAAHARSRQGAGEVGNVDLDVRHRTGTGYDPDTGEALPARTDEYAAIGYDPATGAAAVDVSGLPDSYGAMGTFKDAIPSGNFPHELAHTDVARLPHVPPEGEGEGEGGKGKGGGGSAKPAPPPPKSGA